MPPSKCVSVICLNTCRGDVARQVVGCAMRARQCSSGAAQRRPRASSSMPCLTQSRFGASRGSSKWRTHYPKQWRQLIKCFSLIITKVGPSHLEFLRCPNYCSSRGSVRGNWGKLRSGGNWNFRIRFRNFSTKSMDLCTTAPVSLMLSWKPCALYSSYLSPP